MPRIKRRASKVDWNKYDEEEIDRMTEDLVETLVEGGHLLDERDGESIELGNFAEAIRDLVERLDLKLKLRAKPCRR